jgi:hypothetical protein
MAVIQISKIQVRRGLQENLPQLASGEMGWSVDERRLWIGNGTVVEGAPEEGNTEILTSRTEILQVIRSYTFRGEESGYVSRTGPGALTSVVRTLQNKFDEQISLRDFVTPEEELADDYTIPLQRAIDQVFPVNFYSSAGVRRQLHIPAGVYPIIGTITIPPYANIVGDGPRSTIIKKTFGTDSVIRLRDSSGEVGVDVDTNIADAPFEITFSNLTLQSDTDSDVALLESCQYVKFNNVRFQGSKSTPVDEDAGNYRASVMISTPTAAANNISFNQCEFVRSIYGIWTTYDANTATAITVNDSVFDTLYQGVRVDSGWGIKVISSTFDNISAEAIRSKVDGSVTTAFNTYKVVGYTDGSVINGGTPTTAVLNWDSSRNFSIADIFERSAVDIEIYPLVEIGTVSIPPLEQTYSTTGSLQSSTGFVEILPDDTLDNGTNCIVPGTSTAIIDYQLTRNGAVRQGTIKVVKSTSNVATFDDEYSQTADLGVTLDILGDRVYSQTTSTGYDATFKLSVRSFI